MQRIQAQPSPPIERILTPLQEFMRMEAAGGILLIVGTIIALILANTGLSHAYHNVLHTEFSISLGDLALTMSVHHVINDGLMAIFFLVVGLEIKREILVGELATLQKASLPIAAAIGGMVIPALLYVALNGTSGEAGKGWGIPMATDIAFAVGVIALLGKRVPLSLKVFLMAVAIADDIGAVLVIAVFYTESLNTTALYVGFGILAFLQVMSLLGARHPFVYIIPGLALWLAFHESGVHATVAGVLLAFTIPVKVKLDENEFEESIQGPLTRYREAHGKADNIINNQRRQSAIHAIEKACEHVQPPLLRLEHGLVNWVGYIIMPLFALANAGVDLRGDIAAAATSSIAIGISLGLLVGKIVGVTGATFLAVKLGIGRLPDGVNWKQIIGVGAMAGIGFTMSLFIEGLAFSTPEAHTAAKVGILAGSLVAGTIGFLFLRHTSADRIAPPADDA